MKIRKRCNKICVLGAGLWGTALANHLAQEHSAVWLWEFFPDLARRLQDTRRHPHIPSLKLKPSLRVSSDLASVVRGSGLILMALPSAFVRATARKLRALLTEGLPMIVNVSKGVEPRSLRTMGSVLEEELPPLRGKIATLSGPSFAKEVARGVPTKMLLAGPPEVTKTAAPYFNRGALRVELSRDRLGAELGGSVKNVLAIACGILDGLNAGANTKAALMVQGLSEMRKVAECLGGRGDTVYGLSGLGDLIATGTSPQSRNRTLGEKLGRGKSLKAALREIPTVAEGVDSSASIRALVKSHRVKAPLLTAIWKVLHRGARAKTILRSLGF